MSSESLRVIEGGIAEMKRPDKVLKPSWEDISDLAWTMLEQVPKNVRPDPEFAETLSTQGFTDEQLYEMLWYAGK